MPAWIGSRGQGSAHMWFQTRRAAYFKRFWSEWGAWALWFCAYRAALVRVQGEGPRVGPLKNFLGAAGANF